MDVACFTGSVLSVRSNVSARSTAGGAGGLHVRPTSPTAMVTDSTFPPAVADERCSTSLDLSALRASTAAPAAVSRSNSVSSAGKPLTKVPVEEYAFSANKPTAPAAAAVPQVVPRKVATRLDISGIYTQKFHLPFYGGRQGTVVVPAPLPPSASKAAGDAESLGTSAVSPCAPSPTAGATLSPSAAAAAAAATLHPSKVRGDRAAGSEVAENRPCGWSSLEQPPLEELRSNKGPDFSLSPPSALSSSYGVRVSRAKTPPPPPTETASPSLSPPPHQAKLLLPPTPPQPASPAAPSTCLALSVAIAPVTLSAAVATYTSMATVAASAASMAAATAATLTHHAAAGAPTSHVVGVASI
ncbi:hypothetical protein HDU96_010071 [Phlyctochytrium bullatum]|nr:hypothetical protein HDU96_010071 [Phlyctochytrium bullatum]